MKKNYRPESDCLNCGYEVDINFCSYCGQENLQIKESFGQVIKHVVSDYFHFDHQLLHTLKPLFFQPGKLTNEYMAGHRTHYLHPVKMYIFISVAYFLLLFQSANAIRQDGAISTIIPPVTTATSYPTYMDGQRKLLPGLRDNFLLRLYNKKAFFYQEKYGSRAGEVFLNEFKHNIPKMMFILLPLFATILFIAFRDNKQYYVVHLFHSLHLHCFLFLFIALIILLQILLPVGSGLSGWLKLVATFYISWYIFQSFRTVYHRSKLRTVLKMIWISVSYLFTFAISISVALLITALLS